MTQESFSIWSCIPSVLDPIYNEAHTTLAAPCLIYVQTIGTASQKPCKFPEVQKRLLPFYFNAFLFPLFHFVTTCYNTLTTSCSLQRCPKTGHLLKVLRQRNFTKCRRKTKELFWKRERKAMNKCPTKWKAGGPQASDRDKRCWHTFTSPVVISCI